MVRLKREIEGVRRHPGVPVPAYALTSEGAIGVLPWLDSWLVQQEPGRVLFAGAPRVDLARTLARAGHWVTVCDLADGEATALQARLTPAEAGRLTLVERDYGEAAFGPSSFDLIVLADALHRYREPRWLINKAHRELKIDGRLALRALVQGAIPVLPTCLPPAKPLAIETQLGHTLARVARRLPGRLGFALLGAHAREAMDRGAHLHTTRFAQPAAEVIDDVQSLLAVEQVAVGHSQRLRLAEWCWDARAPIDRVLPIWLGRLPALATPADLERHDPRVVAIIARKKLGYRGD